MNIAKILEQELNIKPFQVENTIQLIDDDNTIPFIARYRKEKTGSLDDTILRNFYERLTYLRNLESRQNEVIDLISAQDKLTEELKQSILNTKTISEIDDIYRPYRPKRRTRAMIAKEKGLEPLAMAILEQDNKIKNFQEEAKKYINEENDVNTSEDALNGAMDIIAEQISDDAQIRKILRMQIYKTGVIKSVGTTKDDTVYKMYYEYTEAVNKIAQHRILALDRGEKEKILKVSVEVDNESCINLIKNRVITCKSTSQEYLEETAKDSFTRLIFPSLERELRNTLTQRADDGAISVFSENLKNLLMQPPVKNRVTLGLDPAYRTGCKIAVVDEIGKVLDTTVIYPTPPQNKTEQAKQVLKKLITKHGVNVISIGNGTASRESEFFVAELIKEIDEDVSYVIVNEAGASVYSASKLGAEEFPQYDVSIRSAVSIARRLQDPLAELVKIDPKSIGVGQYQHDMPQKQLGEALDGVVENCVNSVGVDLNTASVSLLQQVSGIKGTVAKNIVLYRDEIGRYTNRKEILKVAKLGKKAFEQSAGFLRISDGENILDNTGVHPESYDGAKKLLKMLGYTQEDVKNGNIKDIKEKSVKIGIKKISEQINIGEITLRDIINELLKPGRDPREELAKPILRTDVLDITQIKPDMVLNGTVRNVIDFGAFVDIGVHEDGLVHISQICNRYIKHPSEVLKVGDIIKVKVIEVDTKRKRIALTMKNI